MYLYIDFYIYNKETDKKILFWSCALDTICTGVDYKYLNNGNKHSFPDFPNLSIIEEFKEFSIEDIGSNSFYQKRMPVFLPKDETFETGSPYKNCCSELINYYKSPELFASELKAYFASNKDYEIHEIQKVAINKIKELVGFDLTKMHSYPGCISVFQPLPQFDVYIDLKNNAIRISSKSSINDFIAEIEGLSVETSAKSNVVFKQLYYSENNTQLEIHLPENIETFYTARVTVFQNDQACIKCIYEESFHMVKTVSFGMNLKSGNTAILKNRFLNNQIEKKELSDRQDNFSVGGDSDFTDWDWQYNQYLFGKEKRFLESHYFFKNFSEKKKFLNWIRTVLSDAKKVFIIDPFLSFNGFNDFVSCYNSYFSLIVVTTDPVKLHRTDDKNNKSERLAEYIYEEFPSSQVFYVDKDELHDRYMIVESADETKYYSFSNSWQGVLKDYSLFIQEIDYESSLKLRNDYEKIIESNQAVTRVQSLPVSESCENKKTDVKISIEQAKAIVRELNENDSVEHIITSFCNLFNAAKNWWEVLEDFDFSYNTIKNKVKEIIPELVKQLLKVAKKGFEEKKHFITGEKFSSYIAAQDIMERLRTHGFSVHSYYDLGLDYALFYSLACFFVHEDSLVISELEKQENEIFDFDLDRKYKFFISEQIIYLILSEHFALVNDRNISEAVKFAKKSKYSYCRLYVAEGIYNGNYAKDFLEMIKYIEQISLSDEELICLLYSMYTSKIFYNCRTQEERDYPKKIEQYVHDKFLSKDINFILQFSRQSYFLSLRKFNLQGFERFSALFNGEKKNEICEKTYLFLLLYAVRKSQNNKLYAFLKNELNIDSHYFDYIENIRDIKLLNEEGEFAHKKSVVDISEFRSQIPLLASALATEIEKKENVSEVAKKLLYKFDIQKKLLTGTCSYYDAGLDYFSLLIILHALYLLKDDCSEIIEYVKKIEWYVPVLLNSAPDDFYNFSYSFIGLYFQFLNESEKQNLFEKLSDTRIKVICMSMLNRQKKNFLKEYKDFFSTFVIDDDYDKSKNILYALNVFVDLCLIKHAVSKEDKDRFNSLCQKISDCIPKENNSVLENILSKGIIYINKPSEEAKTELLKSMDGTFFPYSVLSSVEGETKK